MRKGDEIRASEKTKKNTLTSDLQRLVDEGSLSMEEALQMQGGSIAKGTGDDEANETSVEQSEGNNNVRLLSEITEQNMELNMTIDALRNDLRNRCQKVIELELALDKEKDKLKILESSSNETAAQQKQRRACSNGSNNSSWYIVSFYESMQPWSLSERRHAKLIN